MPLRMHLHLRSITSHLIPRQQYCIRSILAHSNSIVLQSPISNRSSLVATRRMSTVENDDTTTATTTATAEQTVKSKPLRRIRVYTRTGDKGTTSLFTSERLPKSSSYFHALGTIDETNAHIGLAAEYLSQLLAKPNVPEVDIQQLTTRLTAIQSRLFDLGAVVATPPSKASAQQLRKSIDSLVLALSVDVR